MPIVEVETPPSKRRGNERLSAQEVKQLAELLRKGKCASDGETVPVYQTCYNRARSAQRRLWDEHEVEAEYIIQRGRTGYKWVLEPV